ncbi:MAG: ABC transporter permease [Clostridiales bacterium]|nr:ABC transporter permease [Clostridiales bacterium]
MVKYILKRIGIMILTLWVIITATFFLMNSKPGNPVRTGAKRLPEQVIVQLERKYGFDRPLVERYVKYMKTLLKGDMGDSIITPGENATDIIKDFFPASARVGLQAVSFGLLVGLILGIIAAFKRNTIADYLIMLLAIIGVSVPSFVIASLIQTGVTRAGLEQVIPTALWYDEYTPVGERFKYTILPTLALSFSSIATYARYMRASVLDVINQDYILTAKAKGLSQLGIAIKHILRNAILPIITILGPQIATIVTGTIVIERIFAIPGLGNSLINAINQNDYNIIMGLTIFFSALYIISLLVVDIAYSIIDPRIKLEGSK